MIRVASSDQRRCTPRLGEGAHFHRLSSRQCGRRTTLGRDHPQVLPSAERAALGRSHASQTISYVVPAFTGGPSTEMQHRHWSIRSPSTRRSVARSGCLFVGRNVWGTRSPQVPSFLVSYVLSGRKLDMGRWRVDGTGTGRQNISLPIGSTFCGTLERVPCGRRSASPASYKQEGQTMTEMTQDLCRTAIGVRSRGQVARQTTRGPQ